jgi:hypothetical protein
MISEEAVTDQIGGEIIRKIDDLDKYGFSSENMSILLSTIQEHVMKKMLQVSYRQGLEQGVKNSKEPIPQEPQVEIADPVYVSDENKEGVTDGAYSADEVAEQIINDTPFVEQEFTPAEEKYIEEVIGALRTNNGELLYLQPVKIEGREAALIAEAKRRYNEALDKAFDESSNVFKGM